MRPHVLELELGALRRLSPALRGLATKLNRPTPLGDDLNDPASETPTLVAARSVSAQALSAVRIRIAHHFTTVGDRVDRARIEFADVEVDRAAVITGASGHPRLAPQLLLA